VSLLPFAHRNALRQANTDVTIMLRPIVAHALMHVRLHDASMQDAHMNGGK